MAPTSNDSTASELNHELTNILSSAGEKFGFATVREYPVKGGRLDVVWSWTPSSPIPGLESGIPVAGFEIESSWRTRKHVKGDLLNLQDAGVALGVIVLAGDSDKDDSLRNFAAQLVDRPGVNVLVWTAQDVRMLADAVSPDQASDVSPRRAPKTPRSIDPAAATSEHPAESDSGASRLASATHAGKYSPLHRWLVAEERNSISVTFDEVEEVLGFPLPNSCRHHVPHWHSYDGSAVARAIIDAGWKASWVNLVDQTLTLTRTDH